MPTKLKRITLNLPEDVEMMLIKTAALENRPLANQAVHILSSWFSEEIRKLDYLRPPRLAELEKDRTPPVYEIRPASPAESLKKALLKPDQEGR